MNRTVVLWVSASVATIAMAAYGLATIPGPPPGPPLPRPHRDLPFHEIRLLILVMWTAFFATARTLYWFARDPERQREARESAGCVFAAVNVCAGLSLLWSAQPGQLAWGAVLLLMAAWDLWRAGLWSHRSRSES
jgi:hypothetical protein